MGSKGQLISECPLDLLNYLGTNTGCPVNWYPLSISIPDFPDGPMKKKLTLQF